MSKLAIDGGPKVFANGVQTAPDWPPKYPETAELLKEIYFSGHWSFYGQYELEFNRRFAQYTGADSCHLMANGTVTLEVALQALGIGPGDEVIVPAVTWLATGIAPLYVGATPVIVDIEEDTLCLDPAKVEEAITEKTKAIIPVHLFGSMADMEKLTAIAKKYDLKVIEDCAHAHGGVWDGRHVGTLGDAGSFSFQQSKIMSSGEGGACIAMDPVIGEKLGRLSHIGYHNGAKQGEVAAPPPMGLLSHNYRITEFQAAILLGQLKDLKESTVLKDRNARKVAERLNKIPGLQMQARGRKADLQSYYQVIYKLDERYLKEGYTVQNVIEALKAEGVGAGRGSWGGKAMYQMPLWNVPEKDYRIHSRETAERLLPALINTAAGFFACSDEEVDMYCRCFEKVMEAYGR